MLRRVNAAVRWPVQAVAFMGLAVGALLTGGCANLNIASSKLNDIAPERENRQQQVVDEFEGRRDESQYRAALSAWERGDTRACENQLVQLLQREPTHRDARLALADLYLEGQSLNSAESHYRQLIDHHPDDAQAHYSLGMFLEFTGRSKEARSQFARATELEPENPLFADLPVSATENGAQPASFSSPEVKHTNELSKADAAVAPLDTDEAVKTAANLLQSGKPDDALRLAAQAASRWPNSLAMKRILAAAQLQTGQPAAAQVTLQQALSLDNGDALTYFLLGRSLSEQGDVAAAERKFATAHEIDPRFPARP